VSTAPPAHMASFDGGAGWLNSPPLTPQMLQGKVVLVDFWEYTCINCLRTLPYLREWYRRYHDKGLVIIGVHTPEFHFSGERAHVAAAAKRLGVAWPVVLDDDFAIWKRYGNTIWPHEYLYDQSGRLVESVEGEGGYPQTEARIQALLKSADPKLTFPPVMALLPADSYDKPGAVCYPKTPEILIEAARIANATAFNDPTSDTNYADASPSHADGRIYLQGFWHATSQALVSGGGNGRLTMRYHAIEVMAVMKPEAGSALRVDVMQDGKPIARSDAGADIRYDARGASYVTVDAPRSYDLLANARFGAHDLQLAPEGYGAGIYDFAFESCEIP
ncbi:MAG: redoxin family protein, partial [Candidatus Baltobacteraceae bacterium]